MQRPPVPPDLIETESDRKAIADGCYYDPAAADRVIEFVETFCCHTKAEWFGKPFKLLAWQRKLVRQIYGWKLPDGTRRIREVYVEIPKKNGKTEFVSALVLYHLVADGEMGSEIYLCALTRKQAGYLFKDSVMMIKASPALAKHLVVKDSFHDKSISFHASDSICEVMSSDAPSADGKSSAFTAFDELHRQRNPELWNVMRYAGSARRQPILFSITTAGVDRLSVCYRQHEHAERVRTGATIDVGFLGVVYGADPEKDDLEDPAVWARVNPAWGETIRPGDFAGEFERAKADPIQFDNFIRLKLNVWTEAASRLIDSAKWDACGAAKFTEADLAGLHCFAALDLSSISDITAWVLTFPAADGSVRTLCRFWIPEEYARLRQRQDRIPYLDWAKRGYITLTPGGAIDYDQVKASMIADAKRFKLDRVYYDPHNALQIALQLTAEGLPMEEHRQGFVYLGAPTKHLLKLVLDENLHHGGNPVLDWMAGNARAIQDVELNVKISKKHSKDKVDGMVALAMTMKGLVSPPVKKRLGIGFAG